MIVHVVPINDLKRHDENGTHCACDPRTEDVGEGKMIVHNAYDGREFYETEEEARQLLKSGH